LLLERLESRITPSSFFLSMPSSGYFAQGDIGTVMNFPISVNALTDGTHVGLAAASITVAYPLGVFSFPVGGQLASSYVSLGSVPLSDTAAPGGAADWILQANCPVDGVLSISLSAKTGDKITTNPGGGTLALINFPVNHTYNPAGSTGESIQIVNNSAQGHTQISANSGNYTLSPAPPYSGSVTINSIIERPPTITTPQSYSGKCNSTISQAAPGLLVGASDPQMQAMQVTIINGAPYAPGAAITLPSGATLTVQGSNGIDGAFTYVPAPNFVGQDSFTFNVSDQNGNTSSTGTVDVNLIPTLKIVPDPINPDPTGPAATVIREDVVLDNPNPGGVAGGGLTGFDLAIKYRSSDLSISPGAVLLAPDIASDWTFNASTTTPGQIGIAAFGSGSGSDVISGPSPLLLATIDFTLQSPFMTDSPILLVPASGLVSTFLSGTSNPEVTYNVQPPLRNAYLAGVDTAIQIEGTFFPLMITTTGLPDGDVGASYEQVITSSGGTGLSTFFSSGTLPPGLSLSASGLLSGTPTAAGTYAFTVIATDQAGATASQAYSVTVNPALTLSPTLPDGEVNVPYRQVVVTGGSGSYDLSTSGAFPAGLTLGADGVLSGTPTAAGNDTFTVSATDALGGSVSQSYTITFDPAVTIMIASLPDGDVAGSYLATFQAAGGSGSYTFNAAGGALPPGLSLSPTGVLNGSPTTAGTYNFAVAATDALGGSSSQSYEVTIHSAPAITTTTLGSGDVSSAYGQTIDAAGGSGLYEFHVSGGSLPSGLTLGSSGVLFGTPLLAGSYAFTITVTDTAGGSVSQDLALTINPSVALSTPTLANGDVNVAYAQTLVATGGSGGPYTFNVTAGSLPASLSLSSSGLVSGTPMGSGPSYTFTVTATDSIGGSGSRTYTIVIYPAVAITVSTLTDWTVTVPSYNQTIGVSGGSAPYSFGVTAGTLPSGLALGGGTGLLSGTPSVTGNYMFTLTVADLLGGSASQSYTVTINPGVVITTSILAGGTRGVPYLQTLTANGGTGMETFTGAAPDGLTLSANGILSGIPVAAGSFTFTVTAVDAVGGTTSKTFNLMISQTLLGTLPNWTVNKPGYNQTIVATGGTPPYTFTGVSGTLPPGLMLSSAGVISGTPTLVGSFSFALMATDSAGDLLTNNYTVTINPVLTITTTTLPNWTVSHAFLQTISATGGTGTLAFSQTGTVPTGLTLNSVGVLSGTPTVAGTYHFGVTFTDALGSSASAGYTVIINPAIAFLTGTLVAWTVNQPGYSQTVSAGGGTGALTFSESGVLPAGISFSSAGILSGTPTTFGSFPFSATATDSVGASATGAYTLMINPNPIVSFGLLSTVATFNGDNGDLPQTGLVADSSGNLFSIAADRIFEIALGTGTITTLATFNGANGSDALATPMLDSSGNLFGATHLGGAFNDGTVWELPKGSGMITTVASFNGTNGNSPYGGVIEDGSGNLFGTTAEGGAFNEGTIFEVPKGSGTIITLASVNDSPISRMHGAEPLTGLVMDSGGNLFGTTASDFAPVYGTIFEVQKGTNAITTLATFNGSDGTGPFGQLTIDSSGNLFGTTYLKFGSPVTPGTVFELPRGSSTVNTLATFTGLNGAFPNGPLVEDAAGNLFGTTGNGGPAYAPPGNYGIGTVFEVPKGSGTAITLVSFNGANGTNPYAELIEDSSGNLLGTTNEGGALDDGTVFSVATNPVSWTVGQPGYSQTISTSGGTGPLTLTLSGTLPPGLSFSSAGVISGTPTATGRYSFAVTATDPLGASGSTSAVSS
jgi:uncharacterized repeat protein (TIGR03803 family)